MSMRIDCIQIATVSCSVWIPIANQSHRNHRSAMNRKLLDQGDIWVLCHRGSRVMDYLHKDLHIFQAQEFKWPRWAAGFRANNAKAKPATHWGYLHSCAWKMLSLFILPQASVRRIVKLDPHAFVNRHHLCTVIYDFLYTILIFNNCINTLW